MTLITPFRFASSVRINRPAQQSPIAPRFSAEDNSVGVSNPEAAGKEEQPFKRVPSREQVRDLRLSLMGVEQKRVAKTRQTMTFWDFLKSARENPRKYIRSSSQYTVDAIDHFNRIAGVHATINVLGQDIKPVEYAKRPWVSNLVSNRGAIAGQERTLDRIRTALMDNAKKPHPDRMFVLHGPNGTGNL